MRLAQEQTRKPTWLPAHHRSEPFLETWEVDAPKWTHRNQSMFQAMLLNLLFMNNFVIVFREP
jgi:hypothetical protein